MPLGFRILGSLEVVDDGIAVRLGGPRQRALLAALLVEADHLVSRDRLIDELWGDEPPATAENALQAQVTALRRLLPGRIATDGTAYRLSAHPDEIDARRFELAVARAHGLMERHPALAAAQLASALEEWRGPALDGATGRIAGAEGTRLDMLRRTALVDRADVCLALGENETVVAELTGEVAGDPTDERLAGRLMLAQYRTSGPGDAVATFERVRAAIEIDLGISPDAGLLDLRQAIERHDPTLAGPTAGLPVAATPFIGRERDLRGALDALGTSRLLSLVGPGGSGKSRLSIELARAVAAGRQAEVHVVALATLPAGGSVTRLVADRIDVRERRGEPLVDAILGHLRSRRCLLLLDNCEHVLPMVASLCDVLLAGAPGLRILVTSREPLGMPGEVTWPVSGMDLPAPTATVDEILATDSIRLLADRAAAARPGFEWSGPAIASAVALCRRLDGLPLAIELAAARLRSLSLADIVEQLEVRMDLPLARTRRRRIVIARCAPRSIGATSSSRRTSGGCFADSPCFAASWIGRPRSRCGVSRDPATTHSPPSAGWSIDPWSSPDRVVTTRPRTDCWRRSASTRGATRGLGRDRRDPSAARCVVRDAGQGGARLGWQGPGDLARPAWRGSQRPARRAGMVSSARDRTRRAPWR